MARTRTPLHVSPMVGCRTTPAVAGFHGTTVVGTVGIFLVLQLGQSHPSCAAAVTSCGVNSGLSGRAGVGVRVAIARRCAGFAVCGADFAPNFETRSVDRAMT